MRRRNSKDISAYEKYMDWCSRLGIRPAVFNEWFKTTKLISDAQNDMATFAVHSRPKDHVHPGVSELNVASRQA
jgi:hypothetical protein